MGKLKRCPTCGQTVPTGTPRTQAQEDQDLYDISAEWWQKEHPLPWTH